MFEKIATKLPKNLTNLEYLSFKLGNVQARLKGVLFLYLSTYFFNIILIAYSNNSCLDYMQIKLIFSLIHWKNAFKCFICVIINADKSWLINKINLCGKSSLLLVPFLKSCIAIISPRPSIMYSIMFATTLTSYFLIILLSLYNSYIQKRWIFSSMTMFLVASTQRLSKTIYTTSLSLLYWAMKSKISIKFYVIN